METHQVQRGFAMTVDDLRKKFGEMRLQRFIQNVGELFSLITIGTSYLPTDVEYVIGSEVDFNKIDDEEEDKYVNLKVAAIDFGLALPLRRGEEEKNAMKMADIVTSDDFDSEYFPSATTQPEYLILFLKSFFDQSVIFYTKMDEKKKWLRERTARFYKNITRHILKSRFIKMFMKNEVVGVLLESKSVKQIKSFLKKNVYQILSFIYEKYEILDQLGTIKGWLMNDIIMFEEEVTSKNWMYSGFSRWKFSMKKAKKTIRLIDDVFVKRLLEHFKEIVDSSKSKYKELDIFEAIKKNVFFVN
jgi:hypothetical protein